MRGQHNEQKMNHYQHVKRLIILTLLLLSMVGCAVKQVYNPETLPLNERWVLLPVANLAEAPMAGERTEAILATWLQKKGISKLNRYRAADNDAGFPGLNEPLRVSQALDWAKKQSYTYALTGSVEEWRYKSGLDGEPAVGLSLRIIDLRNGQVVWAASGARTGWGYESLSGTANKLIGKLLNELDLQ